MAKHAAILKAGGCHTVDSESLARWAAEEMKVPGITARTDLNYICRGEMFKVWQFLVNNVTSKETAKLIHDNIRFQRAAARRFEGDTEEDNPQPSSSCDKLSRYKLLQEQLNKHRRELSKLEEAIRRDEADLCANSIAMDTTVSKVRDAKVKACLFSQHHQAVTNHIKALRRLEVGLQLFINKYNLQQKEESLGFLKFDSHKSSQHTSLAQVRTLHKAVAEFLQSLLEGASKPRLQADHLKIKKLLSELMSDVGSEGLLKCLVQDTVSSTARLDEEIAAIDHEKDAERLRFRVVNEGLVDESKEPSLLMEERQLEHQQMFLNTEKCKVESNFLKQKAAELRKSLHSASSFQVTSPGRNAIIMEIVDNTVAARKTHAARAITNRVIAELHEQVQSSSEQLVSLKRKEAAIMNFKTNVQSKQNQICSLMKQNMASQVKLGKRQTLITSMVHTLRENAEPHHLLESSSVLSNHTFEIRQLRVLPLHYLSTNSYSVVRGIHRASGKSAVHLRALAQHLNFPYFIASDAFLLTLLRKKNEVLQTYTQVHALPCREELKLADQIMNQLLPEMRQSERSMLQTLLPLLQDSKGAVEKGHQKCDRIYQLIEEWWHQPALKLDLSI